MATTRIKLIDINPGDAADGYQLVVEGNEVVAVDPAAHEVTSVNGRAGAVTLAKSDVGLGNADNTSDANKPVSTAQATALAAKLAIASNLADLASPSAARTSLGLTAPATASFGAGAGTVCEGNDARLTNSRTPTAHATSHLPGGSDALTTATATSLSPGGSNAEGSAASLARSDHTHALPAYGSSANTICQGNDARLSDARTPVAHASSHGALGSDPVTLAESQVTGLVADLAARALVTTTISPGTGLSGGGSLAANRTLTLADTAVTPGAYGSASSVTTLTVDQQGRLTAAGATSIAITESQVTSLTTDLAARALTATTVSAGTGLTGGGSLASNRTLTLADTAVTPGSYGSASAVATLTADQQGRLTAAGQTAIAIAESQVTGLTADLAAKQAGPLTGDVTTSGAAATIAGQAVSFSKMQNIATSRLLGRSTAGSGSPEELTIGSGLTLSAGALSATGGTVTTVSVASANGLAGTVTNPTTTPAITLSTTITGVLKGNGTAIAAATAGTDYLTTLTGDVTTSGNAATLANTAVTAASYTYASLTVDAKGRLTAASSGANPLNTTAFSTSQTFLGTSGIDTVTSVIGNTSASTASTTRTLSLKGTNLSNPSKVDISYDQVFIDARSAAYAGSGGGVSTSSYAAVFFGTGARLSSDASNFIDVGINTGSTTIVASGSAATWGTGGGILTVHGRDGLNHSVSSTPGAGTRGTSVAYFSNSTTDFIFGPNAYDGATTPSQATVIRGPNPIGGTTFNTGGGALNLAGGQGTGTGDGGDIIAGHYNAAGAGANSLNTTFTEIARVTKDGQKFALGKGLNFVTGSNARVGTATLVGGTATVTNTGVTANSYILPVLKTVGGVPGNVGWSVSAGASFTLTSDNVADTSTYAWLIIETT